MLKRKLAIISLSFVLALALTLLGVLALDLVIPSSPSPDLSANAAVSAAGSFDKLLNGSKYYYSTANSSNSNTAVTVDSSQGHGTQKNPFVINNINQWQLFINVINANNTTYNAAGKYYVLGNNLALSDITPVGTSSSGFKGILCGNKHTITVSSFSGTVYAANKANVRLGLFDRLIGAQIYDIIVTLPTITLTHSTISASTDYVGGLAVQCDNNTILANVNTTVNATRNDTKSTRVSGAFNAGGLVAYCSGGKFYKCSTVATFAYNKTVGNSGDSLYSGGAVGTSGAGTLIIDSCSFKLTASVKLAAGLTGGVIGVSTGSLNNQWQNLFVNANLYKYNASGTSIDINTQNNGSTSFDSSCDWGSLIGWNGDVVYTSATTSYYKNIYVTGTHPGQLCGVTGGPYCNFGSKSTNIITAGAAPSNTQWGSAANTGVNNTNVTSTANVVSRANQNGTLTGNFTINSNGTVTSKVNSTYNLSYIKGAGATGGPSDTTYSYSSAAQTKSGVASPSRTGYTFKGWSLASHKGALSNTDKTKVTIPAGQRGNINVYAVWELNAFTGSASGATVTYGSDATLSASGIGHPAGTTNSSYGVTLSYQWKNSAGTAISGATSSTYKLTTPGYTAGTNYSKNFFFFIYFFVCA